MWRLQTRMGAGRVPKAVKGARPCGARAPRRADSVLAAEVAAGGRGEGKGAGGGAGTAATDMREVPVSVLRWRVQWDDLLALEPRSASGAAARDRLIVHRKGRPGLSAPPGQEPPLAEELKCFPNTAMVPPPPFSTARSSNPSTLFHPPTLSPPSHPQKVHSLPPIHQHIIVDASFLRYTYKQVSSLRVWGMDQDGIQQVARQSLRPHHAAVGGRRRRRLKVRPWLACRAAAWGGAWRR